MILESIKTDAENNLLVEISEQAQNYTKHKNTLYSCCIQKYSRLEKRGTMQSV